MRHIRLSPPDEICSILGYDAVYSGNSLSTFRGNLSVPSSGVNKSKTSCISWPLNRGSIVCPETSVRNYHYTLRNNHEEHRSWSQLSAKTLIVASTDSDWPEWIPGAIHCCGLRLKWRSLVTVYRDSIGRSLRRSGVGSDNDGASSWRQFAHMLHAATRNTKWQQITTWRRAKWCRSKDVSKTASTSIFRVDVSWWRRQQFSLKYWYPLIRLHGRHYNIR